MAKVLTKGEEEIMQVLWQIEKGFLKDIIELIEEPKPHSNTVATLLKILVDKGFVAYEVLGRNNLYRPLISKAVYGKKTLQQLVKGYFEGSPLNLVSQFVKEEKVSVEELEALLKKLRATKKS
jgi:BlaI family transcriptional regulator, penicillinase repressor